MYFDEMTPEQFKALLREAMGELTGELNVRLAPKWDGGTIVLKPGDASAQAKEIPLETFFHKIVMLRDRLRVLEQKVNAHPKLTDAEKVEMQQYVSRIYGTLTTFNVLFRDAGDKFKGEGKE